MTASTMRTSTPQAGTWTLDPAHTHVGFAVRHLMAAKVRGSFKAFDGKIDVADDPTGSVVEVSIDAASIDTGAPDRDAHLRSGDFLDAATYPTLAFRSTAIRAKGDGYDMEGELTIRDLTRPVTLDVEYLGLVTDPWGTEKAAFSATTSIDRDEWGLTWNQPLETGGWLVGKTVHIEIEAQAVKA
ncbi:MAG TPA: YceI family protein [Acidimicrobiia bacterium]|jgi:polyisoprenoid-binding protein YceI